MKIKSPKRTKKPCTCMEQIDKQLAEYNQRLPRRVFMNFTTGKASIGPVFEVVTEKINSTIRKPLKTVLAAHCPCCGAKLPERN